MASPFGMAARIIWTSNGSHPLAWRAEHVMPAKSADTIWTFGTQLALKNRPFRRHKHPGRKNVGQLMNEHNMINGAAKKTA